MASSSNQNDDDDNLSNIQTTCQLAFHGAAANSCPHSLLWVRAPPPPPVIGGGASTSGDGDDGDGLVDTIIYASSGVINLATSHNCLSNNVTSVDKTLVTRTLDHCNGGMTEGKKVLARGEAAEDAAAPRSVTALSWVSNDGSGADGDTEESGLKKNGAFGMVAAFSDGTVTSWRYNKKNSTTDNNWVEHVLTGHDPQPSTICERHYEEGMDKSKLQESIADISAANLNYTTNVDNNGGSEWMVATASSKGIFLHISSVSGVAQDDTTNNNDDHQGANKQAVHSRQLSCHAAASVHLQIRKNGSGNGGINSDGDVVREAYLFAGSASPRHNKVWVYTIPYSTNNGNGDISSSSDAPSTTWVALPTLTIGEPQYHGHLLGHQDWITCFAWLDNFAAINNGREEALLASSGHDAKIRLWKFSSRTSTERGGGSVVPELEGEEDESGSEDNSDEDEANIDDLEEEQGEARLIIAHAEGNNITTTTAVSLEALLLGHEEAVTSLTWRGQRQSTTKSGNGGNNKPCLLSSSMDRTILLWMEEKDGVWVPISRVGSAGGILGGSIGASLMGFVDATFSPGSNRIVGHGYGGSIHFWTRQEVDSVPSNDKSLVNESLEEDVENEELELQDDDVAMEETARWVADPCITGHFRSVEDMAWDPNGEYLLTTSSDQTTRLWTEVPVSNNERGGDFRWVEAGRPQVHGYDMTSIVCIGGKSEDGSADGGGEPSHRFVSGADEKVLRVFDAPASTLRTLQLIKQSRESASSGGIEEQSAEDEKSTAESQQPSSWRVERAFMPSLGLSNKATADVDQESSKFAGPTNNDEFDETLDSVINGGGSSESVKLKLPSERDLGVTTLWPETRKLFGHESELVCLDAYCAPPSPAGEEEEPTLVASSCKARNDVASAAIRLWDAKKGKCVGILKGGHRSTVSTMSFSRDGKYLASSGKDRRICIWKRVNDSVSSTSDGPGPYELSAAADSAHKRIVWSVHFCPKRPDILASGSRDGLIKVWHVFEVADGGLEIQELLRFESISKAGKNPITAVTFAEETFKGKNGQVDYGILSIGTESGRIEVWAVPVTPAVDSNENGANHAPKLLCAIPSNDSHFDTVKRIAWRPNTNLTGARDEGSMNLTLASCGQDNGVRIFQLTVRKNEGT